MKKLRSFLPGLALMLTSQMALAASWQQLRSGELELFPQQDDSLHIEWQHAWLSDANPEQLYLIDGQGRLARQLDIAAEQSRGAVSVHLDPALGPYRLVVPGYSFRTYAIRHAGHTLSRLNPGQVHLAMQVASGSRFYFRVPAGRQAELAGKHHGGVSRLKATRQRDGQQHELALVRHASHLKFDRLALPESDKDELWLLEFSGSGKVAFWLDGVANLFALQPEALQPSQHWPQAHSRLRLGTDALGPTPLLGAAVPYVVPRPHDVPVLARLNLQATGNYSFVDAIARNRLHEPALRTYYEQQLGVRHSVTLLAGTGRRAVLKADPEAKKGLEYWVDDSLRQAPDAVHYLAFADEPNLNYGSYGEFSHYFRQMLEHLKSIPGVAGSGVRVAAPASSRWINGPFRDGARERTGLGWAERLLKEHGNDIDALAWHEWMVRSLYATRQYSDGIRAAADLVGLDVQGRPRKDLLIDQTNISSGGSLSTYDQDSHFAALWWASVMINASRDGLLTLLNWFHLVDEDDYDHRKGLLTLDSAGRLQTKPVAELHAFLGQNWDQQVHTLDNSSFELDALYSQGGHGHTLRGVNKSSREHQVEVELQAACPSRLALSLFTQAGVQDEQPHQCADGRLSFRLPAQAVFRADW